MVEERPAVWEDDTQMAVLFAPFRDKSLNPASWNQKMKFWTNLITDTLLSSQDIVINSVSLASKFERKGKSPLCLNTVLDEMKGSGKIIALSQEPQLQNLSPSKSWLSWGYQKLVKSPVTWSLKYLKSADSSNSGAKYIVVDILKDKCRRLLVRHHCEVLCDITDSVVEFNTLSERSRDLCKSDLEFYLVIEELVRQKKAVVHQENSNIYVKFCSRSQTDVKPVLESDLQILRIKTASQSLMTKIDLITADIDRITDEAKDFKKKNMIPQALRCMRERKRLQKRIEQYSRSLDLLDNILGKLRHAVSDEMVIKAIEFGTSALKEYTSKTGVDQVTATLDNLAEVMEQQNEIEGEMSLLSDQLDDVNQSDLELELKDLLNESQKQNVSMDDLVSSLSGLQVSSVTDPQGNHSEDLVQNVITDLPDVPKFSPKDKISDKSKPRNSGTLLFDS